MINTTRFQLAPVIICAIIFAVLLRLPYALPGDDTPSPTAPEEIDFTDARVNIDLAQLTSTHARPLFSKTRTPVASNQLQAGSPTNNEDQAVDDIELKGTMEIAGTRRALLLALDDTAGIWLSEGETYRGWTVEQISDDEVLLQSTDETVQVPLYNKETRR